VPYPEIDQLIYDLKHGFTSAMDEDLNISSALAAIFQVVKRTNKLIVSNQLDRSGAEKLLNAFGSIDAVLNIFDFEKHEQDATVGKLLAKRDQARAEKNWALADRLRNELSARGFQVQDKRIGKRIAKGIDG
ncbi:MAG: cysteine--tRNA ligase, partial [Deltaproteobacteria bacterium]|nr:cysteine--tRNA ligase [Deltaproteobacteria bacterium]